MGFGELIDNTHVSARCLLLGHGGYGNGTRHFEDYCHYGRIFSMVCAVAIAVQMILQAVTVQQEGATFTMLLITRGPVIAMVIQSSRVITMTDYFHEKGGTDVTVFTHLGWLVTFLGIFLYTVRPPGDHNNSIRIGHYMCIVVYASIYMYIVHVCTCTNMCVYVCMSVQCVYMCACLYMYVCMCV